MSGSLPTLFCQDAQLWPSSSQNLTQAQSHQHRTSCSELSLSASVYLILLCVLQITSAVWSVLRESRSLQVGKTLRPPNSGPGATWGGSMTLWPAPILPESTQLTGPGTAESWAGTVRLSNLSDLRVGLSSKPGLCSPTMVTRTCNPSTGR